VTFIVDPSGFTKVVDGSNALGEREVRGVSEHDPMASAHRADQASIVFLCIEQVLLIANRNTARHAPRPAKRRS
jgi:hypothetical protein